MSGKNKKKEVCLPERFAEFYRDVLGEGADLQLQMLLSGPKSKVARIIPSRMHIDQLLQLAAELSLANFPAGLDPVPPGLIFDDAVLVSTELAGVMSRTHAFEEGRFYLQSFASYFVIKMLPLEGVDYILDLCASPGGKAIHCYDRLGREKPVIVNEPAGARRIRLTSVLRTYGAQELPVVGIDGGLLCTFVVNQIPLIVLDAPCSGEAHILTQPQRRKEWRPRQTRMLAQRQLSLAVSASHALQTGGMLLYSTCAMSPYENELLIQELLDRMDGTLEPVAWPEGCTTELQKYTNNFAPLTMVDEHAIDSAIVSCGLRFRPTDFGEPFFAILLKKRDATQPKKTHEPYPQRYERGSSKDVRILRSGPGGRAYKVPADWPDLPPLPYLHIGR
jgi:16S rRNA C967 or C1407 C5-methylase (RsmB/RsmF family)